MISKPLEVYIFNTESIEPMIVLVDLDFMGVAVMKLNLPVFVAKKGYMFT